MALGYDFLDWQYCASGYESFHRFTCYRNTFERLRSLYYNFVDPAPQGSVNFFHDRQPYYDGVPRFDEWVFAVCRSKNATCDEHIHSQDWHIIVPDLVIYQFHNQGPMLAMLPNAIEQLGPKSPDLSYLQYSDAMIHQVEKRYGPEIAAFGYEP